MKKILSLFLFCSILFVAVACSDGASRQDDVDDVDIDLTKISSIMAYTEVTKILTDPDKYIGKTMRINGPYFTSYYDETGQYYHYVVFQDVSACCTQGIEFILNGEQTYPDDYPEAYEKIEVIGVFGSYEELENRYYYLAADEMKLIK